MDTLDNVFFFKVGLQLFLAGNLFGLLRRLQAARGDRGAVFVDLKIAGDIGHTIARFVERAAELGIRLMTFIEAAETAITRQTLAAGRAARAPGRFPQFLVVPLLSSLDAPDIRPAWWDARDDHVRFTTPAEAVRLGADHLVVGRPVRSAPDPRDAAQRILDEIDEAAHRRASAAS